MSDVPVTGNESETATALGSVEAQALDNATTSRVPMLLLSVLSLALVLLFDWLFWGHPRGWTIGAYGIVLLVTLLIWQRSDCRRRSVWILTPAAVLLCLQCVEQPQALTIAYGVLTLFTLALVLRQGWADDAIAWAYRWLLLATGGWFALPSDVATWHKQRNAGANNEEASPSLLGHWILPLSLGAVFIALFASANPVIARWLGDTWREISKVLENLPDYLPTPARAFVWFLVLLGVWALLRFRTSSMQWASTPTAAESAHPGTLWAGLPAPLVVRSLLLFNLIFAVQTGLDVYYLWAGGQLPEGLTHGEYARRGAYPLLAATILAALFVLAAFRAGPRERAMRFARLLVYVWLAQNLWLVIAAASRLRLYVDAFTLTRWRIAAAIWMLLVFCGIVWILLRILAARSNLWLVNVNAITAAVVLYACCFVDFDRWIAHYNVTHCRQIGAAGPNIDLAYLESLGPETLPALRYLSAVPDAEPVNGLADTIARLEADLDASLNDWRGWTWRRQRLAQAD